MSETNVLQQETTTQSEAATNEKQEAINSEVDACLKKVGDAMNEISNSETFKDFLKTISKFHNYSFNNALLIEIQSEGKATFVNGASKWKELGRTVKENEKPIKILAPSVSSKHYISLENFKGHPDLLAKYLKGEWVQIPVVNKKTGAEYTFSSCINRLKKSDIEAFKKGKTVCEPARMLSGRFRTVNVYDISQTEGKELTLSPCPVKKLEADVKNFEKLKGAIEKIAGVPISFHSIESDEVLKTGAFGYYSPGSNDIVVAEGLNNAQTIKTMLHESAHAAMHNSQRIKALPPEKRPSRSDEEIQAESVACAVCDYLGLDTSDYSFGYIAGWGGTDPEKFKASLGIIKDTSSKFILSIDKALYPENYKEKENSYQKKQPKKSWSPKSKSSTRTKKKTAEEKELSA